MDGYIKRVREKVGHDHMIFNFAIACIVNERGEVLLQKRGDEGNEGLWGLPGGAMELGESFQEALHREVKEETGIDVEINEFLGIYSKYHFTYPDGDKSQTVLVVFICSPKGEDFKVDGGETLELRYFKKDEIPEIFAKQQLDIINDWAAGKRGVYC